MAAYEGFTEEARRAVGYALLSARECGAASVEPEHLLLGVLQAAPTLVPAHLCSGIEPAALSGILLQHLRRGPSLHEAVEISHSRSVQDSLDYAEGVAAIFNESDVSASHILLILLREGSEQIPLLQHIGIDTSGLSEYLLAQRRT
jgi:ATP-dependent Clp protease ATP-binding subunit ClpC